jgi:hypothetical protein
MLRSKTAEDFYDDLQWLYGCTRANRTRKRVVGLKLPEPRQHPGLAPAIAAMHGFGAAATARLVRRQADAIE